MRAFGIVFATLAVVTLGYFLADAVIPSSSNGPRASEGADKSSAEKLKMQRAPRRHRVARAPQRLATNAGSSSTTPSDEEPSAETPPPREEADRAAELSGVLDSEYALDSRRTRESTERENAIEGLFSKAKLGDVGQLQSIECREKICRGTISISSKESDREVFEKTFLSADFVQSVPDAVSIASREELSDGTVLATFFVHPQSVFDMIPR